MFSLLGLLCGWVISGICPLLLGCFGLAFASLLCLAVCCGLFSLGCWCVVWWVLCCLID